MPGRTGRATAQGTAEFARAQLRAGRVHSAHFRPAPGGLELSSLGLGTYLGDVDAATDRAVEEAVRIAVGSGRVNVLDTAINYRHQRAERSIGRALGMLLDTGKVGREAVFVATKAGYLAPDSESPLPALAWIQEELVRTGRLRPEEVVDGVHAMSPTYLADQLRRSRANLGLETLDLVYLHNAPEAQMRAVGRPEFERRLAAAFAQLEEERRRGGLTAYGLATWDCLRVPATDPGHFSVETAVRIAREVGGEEAGLRYIQFPFNLAMPEAALRRNQPVGGERHTLFDAALRLGLGTFTSVPLLQGELARSGPAYGGWNPAQTAIQFARSAPGTIGPVIGQKRPEHLSEDLAVAALPPLDRARFAELLTGGWKSTAPPR